MSYYYAGGCSIAFDDPGREGFDPEQAEIHTFRDWHIIPDSRPLVAPPEVKTEYIDVPGADGSLDYTEALAGIKFKNREGKWSFYVMNGYQDWDVLYNQILTRLHGRRKKIWLESDPKYYYLGRVFVDEWNSKKDWSRIDIRYIIEPYKYPLHTTAFYDWLWNELFNNVIYYGTFDVDGTKERNIINPTEDDIYPAFSCTSEMLVTFGERTYHLPAGESNDPGICLSPGDNCMSFAGNGRVVVDYSTGRTI